MTATHTKTQLAPAIVFSLAVVHLALLLSDTEFEAAVKTLISSTLTLIAMGCFTFGYLLNPILYQWLGDERGGLTVKQVQTYESSSRKVTNFISDFAGNLGILAFLGSTFALSSYQEAIQTCTLLYLGAVLPNVHHYFWEERSLKLICTNEFYQLARRVVAACALVYFSQLYNEPLPGTVQVFPSSILMIPIVPCVIMSLLRFAIGFLWYGPLFGKVWLPAIREFKRDETFPDEKKAQTEIPYFLAGGFVCGQIQNFILLPLQAQMGAVSLPNALKLGYTLFFFFVLPTVSVDMWEGKPYRLSFVNYSNYLVELCLLFSVNAIYQSMQGSV